jgi:hypothetical protein
MCFSMKTIRKQLVEKKKVVRSKLISPTEPLDRMGPDPIFRKQYNVHIYKISVSYTLHMYVRM